MEITINQHDFYPALQSVARSCGIRSSLPVLSNVLLQTENGKLKLSATNLEIGVIKYIEATITQEGALTIPAKTLIDVVSSLSGPINFEASSDQLKISTPQFNATLNGVSAEEFPAIPLAAEESFLIDKDVLISSIPQITFAAAADEGRPVLTGILTQIKGDTLELVATDGFRLAHKTTKLNASSVPDFKSLIPKKTFEEVIRLISESPQALQSVEVSTTENQNQIIFKLGDTELSSRLIEGHFPSWEKILPQSFENTTILDRNQALKAVKLASVFARDAANIVKIQTLENSIDLSSETKELGSQKTSLEAKTTGQPIEIAFNAKFLIDALSACDSGQIKIEFSGNLSPALIKPMDDQALEYVIMPIRLN